jgi:rRNA-processing protein FCF1
MKEVILDTNFLLTPIKFKVDIFGEIERIMDVPYQLCIIDKTIDELDNIIAKQKGKERDAAKLAKKILEKKGIHIIKTDKLKNVDQILLERAREKSFIVATQDMELKRRLKGRKIGLIILRNKKYLEIEA